jgi:poly-gamma-glutamate capsule biosynthesis protein CapA/YwtB (metallophosphatase superfamily)
MQMLYLKRPFLTAAVIAMAATGWIGCEQNGVPPLVSTPAPNESPISEAAYPTVPSVPEIAVPMPAEATLVAVGDIMMHTPQLPGAYDSKSNTYNFNNFFAPVRAIITEADWAVGNLETPIAGDERGFHGFPRFNAPAALADALADAGFDILSTANNHALDQGFSGLAHTLDVLRAKGLHPIGTAETEEAARSILTLEHNGIVAAFLSYTYGTNGIPIPKDKPYAVQLINDERMAADIAAARKLGADLVSVSLHFGIEYQQSPNDEQRRTAARAIQAGADIIIGHHPHVVQPYEWLSVQRDDGTIRRGLVMYSLGNFISNQFGGYKEYGAILKVTFRKTYQTDGTADLAIAKVDAIPTWVHKYVSGGKSRYRILSLDEIMKDGNDPILTKRLYTSLREKAAILNRHLDSLAVSAAASETTVTEALYR